MQNAAGIALGDHAPFPAVADLDFQALLILLGQEHKREVASLQLENARLVAANASLRKAPGERRVVLGEKRSMSRSVALPGMDQDPLSESLEHVLGDFEETTLPSAVTSSIIPIASSSPQKIAQLDGEQTGFAVEANPTNVRGESPADNLRIESLSMPWSPGVPRPASLALPQEMGIPRLRHSESSPMQRNSEDAPSRSLLSMPVDGEIRGQGRHNWENWLEMGDLLDGCPQEFDNMETSACDLASVGSSTWLPQADPSQLNVVSPGLAKVLKSGSNVREVRRAWALRGCKPGENVSPLLSSVNQIGCRAAAAAVATDDPDASDIARLSNG